MEKKKSDIKVMQAVENMHVHPKEKEESRSRRVNIIVKPSVYSAVHKKCKRLDISVNEAVNQFFESWIKE